MKTKSNPTADPNLKSEFEQTIETETKRRLKSLNEGKRSPWFGLGMFGLVGWSIALPTVGGVMIGSWIDDRWPSQVSWKLMLLFVGVVVGFAMACYWMRKEFNQ